MSQMSQLERHARTATAMSLLNEIRHLMIGRKQGKLSEAQIRILQDAIELSEEDKLSRKMIRYSLRGLGEGNQSAALELSDAIIAALVRLNEEGEDWEKYARSLRNLINSEGEVGSDDRRLIGQFTMVAMDIISAESRERSDTQFRARVI